MTSDDLSRILLIAKVIEIEIEELINVFASYKQEEHLLPEILRIIEVNGSSSLRTKVVELYARKSEALISSNNVESISEIRLGIDNELSVFLSRYVDVDKGAKICAEAQLWRSATLLALRQRSNSAEILRILIRDGAKNWSVSIASQIMSCASSLDWGQITEQEVGVLVSLLCEWQANLNSVPYHETCLRLSIKYMKTFPKHCSILYLVSAMYIISDKTSWTQNCDATCRSISCGSNGSTAITANGQLFVWGDFTNQQNKSFEASGDTYQVV
ncbi:hypothetical protein DICVIV_11148 [Dictyocaulus viviparus]|uniref:Uncharacterized protein n=1 Tax=Dictyocaulus viviparus TaxID=29172 RepID=A0A0D8XKI7_DICVI|nr:hypothetical protein DICVIV_11148 [Dictyocaulus viviparus]